MAKIKFTGRRLESLEPPAVGGGLLEHRRSARLRHWSFSGWKQELFSRSSTGWKAQEVDYLTLPCNVSLAEDPREGEKGRIT